MPEEESGALSGSEETTAEVKTDDSEARIAEAVAKAKKEAEAQAYRRFQSDLDKAKAENSKMSSAIREMEAKQLEALPEDERQKAMLEQIYKKLNDGESNPKEDSSQSIASPSAVDTPSQPASGDDPVQAARARLSDVLRANGFNTDGMDFNDPDKFIKALKSQMSAPQVEEEENTSGGPVDTGARASSPSNSKDLRKVNPADLFAEGFKTRIRNRQAIN